MINNHRRNFMPKKKKPIISMRGRVWIIIIILNAILIGGVAHHLL